MRRKIEKFLAKKQGCDESNIRYTEDGRFDFMGDLEGVLNAVRGKDAGKGKTKGDRKSGKKPAKKGRKDDNKMGHMGMPMHYMPYGMPPPPHGYAPYPPHMPPDMMMSHGKENMMMYPPPYGMPEPPKAPPSEPAAAKADGNVPLAPKPTTDKSMPMFSPWKSATKEDNVMSPFIQMNITPGPSTSTKRDFRSACMSSSRKFMFDSPKPLGSNLGISMGSPVSGLNINGMTPLSNLKGTFSTPYASGMFSEFSHEDNFSLNKALFADEDGRPSAKKAPKSQTPKPKTPKQMRFSFGGRSEVYTNPIPDMQYNRVSISPLSCRKKGSPLNTTASTCDSTLADTTMSSIKEKMPPQSASRTIHFAEERDDMQPESGSKIHRFMPSITQLSTPRKRDADDSRDLAAPSPFDATLTPINSYDQSNWGYQLGFSPQAASMTPCKSPAMPLSVKKERSGALASPSINDVLNKSSPNEVEASDKFESPAPKRQRTTPVVKSEVTGQS
jgi:hypothetical protein